MQPINLLANHPATRIPFRARDRFSLSDERPSIRWSSGQTLEITGILDSVPATGHQAVCSLSAMPEIFDSHAYVHKFMNSLIDIAVNGTIVFSGMIHWRSHEETASYWPAFRFPFDPILLRQGANHLKLTNRTRRDTLGEFYDPELDRAFSPEVAETKLATLYLSTLELESEPVPCTDLHLAGLPASAVAGSPFVIDIIHGETPSPVRLTRHDNAEVTLLDTALEFNRHRTPVHITPVKAGEPVRIEFDVAGTALSCQVPRVYDPRRDRSLVVGGGMETIYWHQIPDVLTDGFAQEYGNAFRFSIDDFLNNLHCITPDRWIPVLNYLVRRRRFYALQRLRVPPYTRVQHADLKTLADLGGKWFSGVSIPEPILHLGQPGWDKDLKTVLEEYLRYFRERMAEFRLPGRPLVTFDSAGGLAGHYYASGLDTHLAEVGPACNAYEEVCCRGGSSPYHKPWGVVAAMLWYYGQGAQYACDDSRARLARLVAYSAYLAGASQVLWEGGIFDNLPAYNYILSPESWRDYGRRLDHPVLVSIRQNMTDLLNFNRAQQLPNPTVHFGILQGVNDIYHGEYNNRESTFGDMSLTRSWQLLSVFLPHVGTGRGVVPHHRRTRRWFSWTPYGQMDVVPATGPDDRLKPYRLLAFAGWNTMTPGLYHELIGYVRGGGTLFMSLPHFTTDTNQRMEWNFFNDGDLSELAGIRVDGLGPRIESIRWQSDLARGFLPDEFVLTPRNPLFPEDFDELYPVFSQDITCFAGAIDPQRTTVHAVSDQGTPVVLEHRLGKGRVILINTWFHPGRGRQLEFACGVLRALAASTPTGIRVMDPTERVAWFEYQETGYRRWMFLNTDWTQAKARAVITVGVGPHLFTLPVQHPDPTQLLWDGRTAIHITDPAVQVRSWKRRGDASQIHLTGGTADAVHILAGPPPNIHT
ncbi:MAG: hypothetical protein A2498_13890 [Lentisphaerae bacterium RIFOXYC12_FULL_60_16]|nr:MAG: hypothetical protein A2498_13890 [Lentisphaerae bacterium RIFOXYC12_FULL_60_16]OGV85428.1 MAG: hypothetical protein A2340_03200 [Lentisphaerae bacterium RIFOXYB12_FULL_60_10]